MIYAVAKFRISSSRIWGNASDYKSLFHDFDINGTKKYYFNAPLSVDTPFTRGLFGTRNERNSIRNIEVSAPSQEGFESHDM